MVFPSASPPLPVRVLADRRGEDSDDREACRVGYVAVKPYIDPRLVESHGPIYCCVFNTTGFEQYETSFLEMLQCERGQYVARVLARAEDSVLYGVATLKRRERRQVTNFLYIPPQWGVMLYTPDGKDMEKFFRGEMGRFARTNDEALGNHDSKSRFHSSKARPDRMRTSQR